MTTKQLRPLQPGSLVERLASLEVGGNVTVSAAHGPANESFDAWVSTTKRRITNTISPAIARVIERHSKRDYEIESGVMVSGMNRVHVVVVVTRLADLG